MDKLKFQAYIDASNFRLNFGLTPNKPFDIMEFLRTQKILTILTRISDNISGMAIKTNKHRFIVVNSKQSLGRQNFTICHELYHLYIQKEFSSMVCIAGSFNKRNGIEYQADLFASQLLIPTVELVNLIPEEERDHNISLLTIITLEQHFKCSRQALLVKLKDHDFITKAQFDDFKEHVKASAVAYGFDETLYSSRGECLVIGDYASKARKLYDNEKISESHYFNLINDIQASAFLTKGMGDGVR